MFGQTYLRRALLAAPATVAVLAVAAGCGGADRSATPGTSRSSAASTRDHNGADVMFAQMMIPHHRQAVEMTDLVPGRAASPRVRRIARQIAGAQGPEIDTMSGWLRSWGEKVPAAGATGGGMSMDDGMMSADDLAKLKSAKGKRFDTLFARLMVAHHNGAVSMARDEQRDGRNPAARKLAGRIVATQTAEIRTLQGIAGS